MRVREREKKKERERKRKKEREKERERKLKRNSERRKKNRKRKEKKECVLRCDHSFSRKKRYPSFRNCYRLNTIIKSTRFGFVNFHKRQSRTDKNV